MDTILAKPKRSVRQAPSKVYCISCERMVTVEQGARGTIHANGDLNGEPINCHFEGGYATVPLYLAIPYDLEFFSGDWAAQNASEEETQQAELNEVGEWLEAEA